MEEAKSDDPGERDRRAKHRSLVWAPVADAVWAVVPAMINLDDDDEMVDSDANAEATWMVDGDDNLVGMVVAAPVPDRSTVPRRRG